MGSCILSWRIVGNGYRTATRILRDFWNCGKKSRLQAKCDEMRNFKDGGREPRLTLAPDGKGREAQGFPSGLFFEPAQVGFEFPVFGDQFVDGQPAFPGHSFAAEDRCQVTVHRTAGCFVAEITLRDTAKELGKVTALFCSNCVVWVQQVPSGI